MGREKTAALENGNRDGSSAWSNQQSANRRGQFMGNTNGGPPQWNDSNQGDELAHMHPKLRRFMEPVAKKFGGKI